MPWDYYKILAYVSSFSVIIPLLTIYNVRRVSKTLWLLYVYLLLSLLTEIALLIIASNGKSNLVFLQFFKLAELILIIEIFKTTGFFKKEIYYQLNLVAIAGYVFLVMGYIIDRSGLFSGFAHTCIIFFSLVAFYKIFLINETSDLKIHPFFWFNLAFFLYFNVSFFLSLFGNLIRSFDEVAKMLWTIHLLANMLLYFILTVGIWKQRNT